jgi:N-acyl-D-amino-acid deacylase
MNMKIRTPRAAIAAISLALGFPASASAVAPHDVILQGGTVYDGAGGKPYVGDVAIDGDRITYVGPHKPMRANRIIDVSGKAIAPGFINVLSHAEETLLADGRAASDLYQGVTLEIMGEDQSMGPTTDAMAKRDEARESDIKYPIDWRTFNQYFEELEHRGVSVNVASFVGAGTVRDYVLGENDVQPTPAQLVQMRGLVHEAMQEGALGVGSALIYAPATYAQTPELTALATEAGRCGGIYITHMRSEGEHILEGVDETIAIAKGSGAPAEIFHLKQAGKSNWSKLDPVIARIEAARAAGVRLTADMYTSTAAATGFDAAMPHWVLDGGLEAWIARMKDPAVRARLVQEMRNPPPGYESALAGAGPDGTLLLAFKNDALKPLTGKTLAEVARMRGESPEETVIDLVIEDNTRIGVAYVLMSEDNVRKEATLPWMSFGSDEGAPAPEGVFLESNPHPRAYDNFARLLAEFVRKDKAVTLPDAIHRLSALPAANLSLRDRGLLKTGYFADVVVFDPDTVQDHATFENPHRLATGVEYVLVNGALALENGKATGSHSGRFVRGRGWTGWRDGGCRPTAKSWHWAS